MIVIDVYHQSRGFGFAKLLDQDGNRTTLYFHISDVIQGDPVVGAQIQCDVEQGKKGFVAKRIRVVQSAGLSAIQLNGGAR
jgi:cold shock CspA family protein